MASTISEGTLETQREAAASYIGNIVNGIAYRLDAFRPLAFPAYALDVAKRVSGLLTLARTLAQIEREVLCTGALLDLLCCTQSMGPKIRWKIHLEILRGLTVYDSSQKHICPQSKAAIDDVFFYVASNDSIGAKRLASAIGILIRDGRPSDSNSCREAFLQARLAASLGEAGIPVILDFFKRYPRQRPEWEEILARLAETTAGRPVNSLVEKLRGYSSGLEETIAELAELR